ncbi:MAG: ribosomal protein [Verrucomicrobiales bacterium]|nr:ribosomal protein [Verrucomicrobiales bacterium]
MKLPVKNIQGKDQGELEVKFAIVEDGRGTQAVHDVIVAYNAAQRMGTACTKTVGEVAGSNKKPWKQKGTGRARAGSFASPLWRGGGVVFGPRPRDFTKKVNSSTRQLALRKALTERIKAGDVMVLDDLKLSTGKTKDFIGVLAALKVTGTTLIVSQSHDKNLELASRNVSDVEVTTGDDLNTYQLLRPSKVVFTRAGYEAVEKRLAK